MGSRCTKPRCRRIHFTIDDLSGSGSGGDLQVSIQEADGTAQVFTVPYTSVPGLLRQGQVRYTVMVGQYRSGNDQQENLPLAKAP